jgi:hypothetical protein
MRRWSTDQGEQQDDGEEEAGHWRVPPLGKSHLGIGQEHYQTTCTLLQSDRLTLPNLQQELKWSFELNGWVLPPLH